MAKDGYVYVVCFENLIKVGYSGRYPSKRVRTHKGIVKSCLKLQLKKVYISEALENAKGVDGRLIKESTRLYGPSSFGREWFSADDSGEALLLKIEEWKMDSTAGVTEQATTKQSNKAGSSSLEGFEFIYNLIQERYALHHELEDLKAQNPIGAILCSMAEEQLSLNSELSDLDEELQVQFANSVNWALNLASKGLDGDALSLYAVLDLLKKVAVGGEIDFENPDSMYVAAIVNIVSKLREKEVPEDELFGMLEIFGILAELADRAL